MIQNITADVICINGQTTKTIFVLHAAYNLPSDILILCHVFCQWFHNFDAKFSIVGTFCKVKVSENIEQNLLLGKKVFLNEIILIVI